MKTYNWLDWVASILVIVGALNWGLVSFFNFDLVTTIFGGSLATPSTLSRIVFGAVGIAGLWYIYTISKVGSQKVTTREMKRAA